jgi:hypothetical protein
VSTKRDTQQPLQQQSMVATRGGTYDAQHTAKDGRLEHAGDERLAQTSTLKQHAQPVR